MKIEMLIVLILFSACSQNKRDCNYKFVSESFGNYSYSGILLNDKIRIGSWNFINVGKIDSIVDYEMGVEKKVTGFYNGMIYFYRYQDSFLFNVEILQLKKKNDLERGRMQTSNNEIGRKVFLSNCLSCHNYNFTSDLSKRNSLDSLHLNTKSKFHEIEKENWMYFRGNLNHLIFGVLSESELEHLKFFLNKNQPIRMYMD